MSKVIDDARNMEEDKTYLIYGYGEKKQAFFWDIIRVLKTDEEGIYVLNNGEREEYLSYEYLDSKTKLDISYKGIDIPSKERLKEMIKEDKKLLLKILAPVGLVAAAAIAGLIFKTLKR